VTITLIYEVECQLDPDIVADYDAWLPGHVRDVLACPGFHGASIEIPESPPGERQRRRIRYRVENNAALDHYLENNATRLRTETAERFGGRVHCERRVFRSRHELTAPAHEPRRCLNCGTVVTGKYCARCGQASDVHVLSVKEVAGDVVHSVLHLDGRAWRTFKLLVRRPGELTREFIAGRHQLYIPPFRLYFAISVLFFALTALLPDSNPIVPDQSDNEVIAPINVNMPDEVKRKLEAGGIKSGRVKEAVKGESECRFDVVDNPAFNNLENALGRACEKMRADGGRHFAERFATTAPKLMFVFLPVMAAVALLFYWRPRRLYAEHLVLFLHNHAFTFLLIGVAQVLTWVIDLKFPLSGVLGFAVFLMYCYLPYYVFRSMRVVYGEGRIRTTLKFVSISTLYVLLLGFTMLLALVYTMLSLS
jgi:Protein of unknown function (DUF3667)/Domain of unknown function (DUF4286)